MKIRFLFLSAAMLVCTAIVVVSCEKKVDSVQSVNNVLELPDEAYNYVNVNAQKGELGRVLFYDKSLSVNNSISCGSCHKQAFAFADNQRFSPGFESLPTQRNTPPLQNLSASTVFPGSQSFSPTRFFWDGRTTTLTNTVVQPMFNHVEMGMGNTADVVKRVKSRAYYQKLFADAYPGEEITFPLIADALSGFVSSIVSTRSKFEKHGSQSEGLSPRERRGFDLFFDTYNCGVCHEVRFARGYPTGGGNPDDPLEMVNVGLDKQYQDKGFGAVTNDPADNGKFKIPNLRNVELTAPYMHDGRFATLEEAIDHYSTGIRDHQNLDFRLMDPATGEPEVFNIPEQDRDDLIAFLKTLTDHGMITDPKFSNPFKEQ